MQNKTKLYEKDFSCGIEILSLFPPLPYPPLVGEGSKPLPSKGRVGVGC